MTASKNGFARIDKQHMANPAERFASNFGRLLIDVDKLMVDVRGPAGTNGDANKGRPNGTSHLHDQARMFYDVNFGTPLERVPIPYLELDEQMRIVRTNKIAAGMLNGSSTPLIGKSLFSFIEHADIQPLRAQIAVARRHRTPTVGSVTIVHKAKRYPAQFRIQYNPAEKEVRYVAVLENTNVSNEASRVDGRNGMQSLFGLFTALSGAPALNSIGDAVGKYCRKAFDSPAGAIFLQKDSNLETVYQWQNRQISQKNRPENTIDSGPAYQVLRTGNALIGYRPRARSRVERYLQHMLACEDASVTFLPLLGSEQSPVGVLAIALRRCDKPAPAVYEQLNSLAEIVSGSIAQTRAYEEAVAARVRAETSVKTQDEFLSAVSHELKNPMTPILGWAVALSSGTLPAERQNFALDVIVRNVRALNVLIHDMFDAVRISSGKMRLETKEIRIQEVAREALTVIQGTAEGKKLRISTEISEAVPPFIADPNRLRQVFLNLLNNAVKFTAPGGSISLKVFRHGNKVECCVSDNGKGIDPKFLPLIFDRFLQENRGAKIRTAGLGLGLTIVREIVNLHGGTITAHSKGIGKGTTFVIQLPLRRSHHYKPAGKSSGHGKKTFTHPN